jgi:2-amino-4-hydroxy-6-hydroxymethyldihydropteridine diphosphokinase
VSKPSAFAYVGVGSNIQPEDNVRWALEALSERPGVTLTGISTFYRTAAMTDPNKASLLPEEGAPDPDPDFLNGVLELRTFLTPENLLMLFAGIENALGRTRRGNRFAPRTIDLDLLLYGFGETGEGQSQWGEIGDDGRKAHRDIFRRAFVACPLMELAPDLILPPHNVPLQALACTFDSPGGKPEDPLTQDLRRRFLTPDGTPKAQRHI